MEIKINDGRKIVDHHLNLKGSKLMANFIFEKKLGEFSHLEKVFRVHVGQIFAERSTRA